MRISILTKNFQTKREEGAPSGRRTKVALAFVGCEGRTVGLCIKGQRDEGEGIFLKQLFVNNY